MNQHDDEPEILSLAGALRMSDRDREIMERLLIDGQTLPEVAAALDMPQTTVRNIHARHLGRHHCRRAEAYREFVSVEAVDERMDTLHELDELEMRLPGRMWKVDDVLLPIVTGGLLTRLHVMEAIKSSEGPARTGSVEMRHRGTDIAIKVERGMLELGRADLGSGVVFAWWHGSARLYLPTMLPATVLAALPGRRARDVVDHPMVAERAFVRAARNGSDGMCTVDVSTPWSLARLR